MARTLYGGAASDVVVTAQVIGQYTVPVLAPGASLTAWTARTGGSQVTDLQTVAGGAVSVVTADAAGRVMILGPDGYTADLWLQDPVTGVRYRLPGTSGGGGGSAGIPESTLTTKGDLVVRTSSAITRLPVGSNGQVLTADSSTTPGVKWATPAGGGGGSVSLPNTLIVAANGSGITGDYQCDGTADEVQINQALTALRAGAGGTVLLTAGVFNLAGPVIVEGFDDIDQEQDLYLRGAGPKNTTLAVGSGVNAGIRLTKCVRAHVWDLGLTIVGASDGIQAVATLTAAAGHRSAWMSTIGRIQVLGPYNGTDTGWPLDLDNMFRARIESIEVSGTTNGMRFSSSHADFNPGDCTVDRCFIDLYTGGNGGAAYCFESVAGQVNQIALVTCHSIANPAASGTVGWKAIGASAHIRTMNCNIEQFATSVQIASAAYDFDIDFVHATVRNGATLAKVDGYDNRVRVGLAYVPASATVTLVDDDNGYSAKPNVFGPMSIYADTGSTVNADVADFAVVRDSTFAGPGTVAAALKVGPGVRMQVPAIALTDAATIATDAALGSYFAVLAMAGNRTLGAPTNASDGQECTWRLTASGGARTPVLATGAGGFVVATGTPAVTVSAIASGSTAELTAVYNATIQRWRVSRYQVFATA